MLQFAEVSGGGQFLNERERAFASFRFESERNYSYKRSAFETEEQRQQVVFKNANTVRQFLSSLNCQVCFSK